MTNLDKIYNTWVNIDKVFITRGANLTPYEFMQKMIGKEDSLVQLRKLIMKDFINSEENVTKMNRLFLALERAKTRLAGCTEIIDLLTFVWGDKKYFNFEELNVVISPFANEEQLLREGFISSVYKLHENKVVNLQLNPLSEKLVSIYSEEEMVKWLNLRSVNFTDLGIFQKKVFLFLLLNKDKICRFPLAFVNYNNSLVNGKEEYKRVKFYDTEFELRWKTCFTMLKSEKLEVVGIE